MGYRARNSGQPPTWFVFLIGVAFVFGLYYLYIGFQAYLETGGSSVAGATEQAIEAATATRLQRLEIDAELPTRRPTSTSPPPCQYFTVIVDSAILRSQPSTASQRIETLGGGTEVCVMGVEEVGVWNWYLIDRNPVTRRMEAGYVREDLIEPINPTATPIPTQQSAPTVTPQPIPTRPQGQPSVPEARPTQPPRATNTSRPGTTPTQAPTVAAPAYSI